MSNKVIKYPTKEQLESFKVGDFVTSEFWRDEEHIIRKITEIIPHTGYNSGFCVSADGGKPCLCCDKPMGQEIKLVDGSWFLPVTNSIDTK